MMKRNNEDDVRLEMHSVKVRNILGEMPKSLTIWSVVVITAVAIALVAALCLLPYPYSGGKSILEHIIHSN